MITLSTVIIGTTMTVGDALLSLGISMAANKVGDKIKGWLTPLEEDALYLAYEKALDRWCKNAGGRDFMRYRLRELKGLFQDYLRGDISSASTEIQELMKLWYEEICKSKECQHYIESGRFKVLLTEINATQLIAKSNGEKLALITSQLEDVDEHIIAEIKTVKDEIVRQLESIRRDITASTQIVIGISSHKDVEGYLPRYCHTIDNTTSFKVYLRGNEMRSTLLNCIMGEGTAPLCNHYVLYGSAQVGKSTELQKLAYDLQQTNLYLPILIESKYYPTLTIENLPVFERKDGKTIVLLIDALDEAADYDTMRSQIEGYSKLHPSIIIVASCRSNYRSISKMQGFKELELEDMQWQEVVNYINNNAERPKQLLASINEANLQPLLTTPFIIKNVVDIFNSNGKLPKDKNELYVNFVTLAYEKAVEKLKPAIKTSLQSVVDYHIRVAMVMQLTKRQSLNKDELLKIASNDETLVDDCLRVNLLEKDGDSFLFLHNAFREYFSAEFLLQKTSLAEVQAIVCYNGTSKIKPMWYNVLLLWLTIRAKQNGGLLAAEIIDWLRGDGSRILVHSDYHYIEETVRTSIFIEILNDHKQKNQYLGTILDNDYRNLMVFGESDDSIAYLIDEINNSTEPTVHLSNMFALVPYIKWESLRYKQPLHDRLVDALKAKLPLLSDDNNDCGVQTFLYTDYFAKQANVYYPLLKDYESIGAMSSLIYMVRKSNAVEQYLDYIITVDGKLSLVKDKVVDHQSLYKAYQQVSTPQSLVRVLKLLSSESYVNVNGHDNDFEETEKILLDKVETLVVAGEQIVIKELANLVAERIKTIYPYIATDAQKALIIRYRRILTTAGVMTYELSTAIEERLVDRTMSDEERERRFQLLQKEFDEFCDYEHFKTNVSEAIEGLKQKKDIANACANHSNYVHEFMHHALWRKEPNPTYVELCINDLPYYEAFRMCVINRVLTGYDKRVIVLEYQKLLAAATARQFIERMLSGNPNCSKEYIDAAIHLVIQGVLKISDDEIKAIFDYSHEYITIPSTEMYESGRNITLFEVMCQQLGDESFSEFIKMQLETRNLDIPELVYLLCADYILKNELEDLYELLLDRIMKDDNSSFVAMLIKKTLPNTFFTERLSQLYSNLKHQSNQIDLLLEFINIDGYRSWALNEMCKLLPNIDNPNSRYLIIANLCEYGEISVLDYLIKNKEDFRNTGFVNFRFTNPESMSKLLSLLPLIENDQDQLFGSRKYAIIKNIIQIAATDKSLVDQAVGAFKILLNTMPKDEYMLSQAIEACHNRYMVNSDHTPDVAEAIQLAS